MAEELCVPAKRCLTILLSHNQNINRNNSQNIYPNPDISSNLNSDTYPNPEPNANLNSNPNHTNPNPNLNPYQDLDPNPNSADHVVSSSDELLKLRYPWFLLNIIKVSRHNLLTMSNNVTTISLHNILEKKFQCHRQPKIDICRFGELKKRRYFRGQSIWREILRCNLDNYGAHWKDKLKEEA